MFLINVQLQLVSRVVVVVEVLFALGTLGVRGRLGARAEVFVRLHALALGHAGDDTTVRLDLHIKSILSCEENTARREYSWRKRSVSR